VSYHYRAFDLCLLCNCGLSGLEAIYPASPDLELCLGLRPPDALRLNSSAETLTFTSSALSKDGEPCLKIFTAADGWTRLCYDDGTEFWIDAGQEHVYCTWPAPLTVDDAASYFLGPVLGLLLRLRGTISLHASGVAIGGQAVLFAGDAGAGKSTTAAAMARRGHAMISDDVVPIREQDGHFVAGPSYPYFSLWPDSVAMLYGPEKELPPFSPTFGKRQLDSGNTSIRFTQAALPLSTVFIFAPRSADHPAPQIKEMSPRDGLLALLANSYAGRTLTKDMQAGEFEFFGRLSRSVRVCSLCPHTDPSFIDRLCELIETRSISR
jgi:HPr Serine kinase C-terminal domain